jgi:recombination protein RecA
MAPRKKRGAEVVDAITRQPPPVSRGRGQVEFVTSGSYLIDLVLGGGWAQGRVANIVGDQAAGKTLVAVEACANFLPLVATTDDIRYIEAEMAFDDAYGEEIGMPPEVTPVDTIGTVEDFFNDLNEFCAKRRGKKTPSLYVVDSLDALSDIAEMKRDISEGSYGATKAAQMSELFRRSIGPIYDANVHLLIVSQLRDKLGVMFGEKQTRSGGRALDYYASQVIWLYQLDRIKKQVRGIERYIGTHVRVRNRKNKVGKPHREAEVTLWYNYGIDDEGSMLDWLAKHKVAEKDHLDEIFGQLHEARRAQDREWVGEINKLLREMVGDRWFAIEEELRPPMSKYARV